ncbi:MAG: hypothetical protein IJD28_03065 [Deferribacterales bacterium]|nr:hypothetical protein [Deferribacterales bacterium]
MRNKYLLLVSNNLEANSVQRKIARTSTWSKTALVSYNLPLLSRLSVCENIMLPLNYSERMSRKQTEPIVKELLSKFGMEQTLHYRQKSLNDYEVLIVKFLRAIMRCPKHIAFIMPHIMVPSEYYADFTLFADTLEDFDITVVEHENFANYYIETNFTEISQEKWETHVLETLK